MSWQFIAGPATGGLELALTDATSRKYTAKLTDSDEIAFSLDGRHPQAAAIDELATDVHVLWTPENGTPRLLSRGRIGPTGDSLDEDNHRLDVAALDYRAILSRRILYSTSTLTYTGQDQALIAWNLLQATQTRTGGDLGISRGIGQVTGIVRDRTYEAGDKIGEQLQALSEVIDGFDWDINPAGESAQTLDIYYPQRGTDRGVVLEYGGLVDKVQRQIDPGDYGNALRMTGADGLTAVELEAPDLSATLTPGDVLDPNSGFESGTTGWAGTNGTFSTVGSPVVSGSLAAKLIPGGVAAQAFIESSHVPIAAGRTYRSIGWVQCAISRTVNLFVSWFDGSHTYISTDNTAGQLLPATTWVSLSGDIVAPAGAVYATIGTVLYSTPPASAILYSDDVELRLLSPSGARPEGRWDVVVGDDDLTTQQMLNDRAAWQMSASQVLQPTYTLTLRPGGWRGPDHIWVGDTVQLVVMSGRLAVDTSLRVYEMAFGLDADGGESVEVTVGGPRPDYRRKPRTVDRRLSTLERR